MPLRTIPFPRDGRRAEDLHEYLRAAILRGVLRPGERVTENSIGAMARMSRTPVREAFHRLEAEGLVHQTRRGVSIVTPSLSDLADLCTVREVLEGLASRMAATFRTDVEAAALMRIFSDTQAALRQVSVRRLVELNNAFHVAIWEASRNRYLTRQLATLRGLVERLQDTTLQFPDRQQQTLMEHKAILDAIIHRDPEAAEARAREHMGRAQAVRMALWRSEYGSGRSAAT